MRFSIRSKLIPPGIASGYKGYGDKLVVLANCASEPHDPDEMERMDPFDSDIFSRG